MDLIQLSYDFLTRILSIFPSGEAYTLCPMHAPRSAALILFAFAFLNSSGMAANQYLNLAATISVYLLITLAIADKAGFVEASIVSILVTSCLEY